MSILPKSGRPCLVADIDFSKDIELNLWDQFYDACSEFHYAEIMGLSRAYGISRSTVENWKYKKTFPRKGRAQQVLDWVNNGKPMKKVSPGQATSAML